MLEICPKRNLWEPPKVDIDKIISQSRDHVNAKNGDSFLYIFRITPYIDALFIEYDSEYNPRISSRFTFYDGYTWPASEEIFFHRKCLNNVKCAFDPDILDEIYAYYNKLHPEWNLRRYILNRLKVLDHIYNCMRKNSAKELLYKAGLDELAFNIYELDELDLLSTKPSDIFGGLSMNVLKSLNCGYGIRLLKDDETRNFVKEINASHPNIFKKKFNDAQCLYMTFLIDNELTPIEVGRLFEAHRGGFERIWSLSQMELYRPSDDDCIAQRQSVLVKDIYDYIDQRKKEIIEKLNEEIGVTDPIYKDFIDRMFSNDEIRVNNTISQLKKYLGKDRKEYDKIMRRRVREKNPDWQERDHGYVVRYPQTINDFWREAIYMQNCLSGYAPAILEGDTTIMFIRREEDVNKPFITMEIYENTLTQAYHRFNKECTSTEKKWIRDYCTRHEIDYKMQ
ncbi:MAG: PcfJ domain-containing protein [Lachnospiraceae bacterium]|nr:PcfJ domain-containing protein [Lachnospiraceae bacterium]